MGSVTGTLRGVRTQPGYDELAAAYDEAFPTGYGSALERHAVDLFVEEVRSTGLDGPVLDVGCGTGHITNDLASRGLDVVGLDSSEAMLAIARRHYPSLRWHHGDARLPQLPDGQPPLAGIVARFSLIHVDPAQVPGILASWAERLQVGATVMVAFQCSDDPVLPHVEFDHKVARAWRWRPDAMAETLTAAGLTERWRLVAQADGLRRFAECHLVHGLGERMDRDGPER